ncbi:MAG: MaoC family dehydratase [Mycobacteriales bacterium]
MAEQRLFYEDVKEGEAAPARSHTLTRTDLATYAGASGDFNPMHHDEVKAKAAGLPSVFGHGMFSMGFLASALEDYIGVGNLTHYKVRFTKQTWPEDVLTTKIVPTAKRQEGGQNLVDLDVELVTDKGVVVVAGSATAALPSRVG